MANEKHLAQLRKGVALWNAWRKENPDIRTNLRGAKLSGANLSKANLRGTKLSGANLRVAKLRGAKLRGADLTGADLSGANLSGADLSGENLITAKFVKLLVPWADLGGALGYYSSEEEPGRQSGAKEAKQFVSRLKLVNPDLSGANLGNAKFVNANLTRANFRGANLTEADLTGANLFKANLTRANLRGANLTKALLSEANLRGANLREAKLIWAVLAEANLHEGDLSGADLSGAWLVEAYLLANLRRAKLIEAVLWSADLSGANLRGATLRGSYLNQAVLVNTDLTGADLTGCRVYDVSAWELRLDETTKQQNLVITPDGEPEITVDNIEVAQFLYLLLNNRKIRDVIDTITSKVVLILGRFTDKRKKVLDALRDELRQRKYLPILFDFEKPRSRSTVETITLLARMARFVVADISDAKSVLQELQAIVPDLPSVPVQPIILAMQEEPGMFDFYRNFRSFLEVHRYAGQEQLIADLAGKVIAPAEKKAEELGERRRKFEAELNKLNSWTLSLPETCLTPRPAPALQRA
jgi:uncharacterized protein YjbI with pentapeptide repeats